MKVLLTAIFTIVSAFCIAQNNPDAILGRWISFPQKNLVVEVFKFRDEYRGKIVWFNDSDDKTRPMNTRLDEKNSNPSLRGRKVLGLEVLDKMRYNAKSNRWESGQIYDAKSGRIWNSSAWITKEMTLAVRGFWHLEFIGQSMNFRKVVKMYSSVTSN